MISILEAEDGTKFERCPECSALFQQKTFFQPATLFFEDPKTLFGDQQTQLDQPIQRIKTPFPKADPQFADLDGQFFGDSYTSYTEPQKTPYPQAGEFDGQHFEDSYAYTEPQKTPYPQNHDMELIQFDGQHFEVRHNEASDEIVALPVLKAIKKAYKKSTTTQKISHMFHSFLSLFKKKKKPDMPPRLFLINVLSLRNPFDSMKTPGTVFEQNFEENQLDDTDSHLYEDFKKIDHALCIWLATSRGFHELQTCGDLIMSKTTQDFEKLLYFSHDPKIKFLIVFAAMYSYAQTHPIVYKTKEHHFRLFYRYITGDPVGSFQWFNVMSALPLTVSESLFQETFKTFVDIAS